MVDYTTTYLSNTLGRVRVCDMHPHHARNALALILSNEDEARRQFSTPVFSSEVNQNLHARAAGLRYAVVAEHPVPAVTRGGNVSGTTTVRVPRFVMRRAEARGVRRANAAAGLRAVIYRITDSGAFEKTS